MFFGLSRWGRAKLAVRSEGPPMRFGFFCLDRMRQMATEGQVVETGGMDDLKRKRKRND